MLELLSDTERDTLEMIRQLTLDYGRTPTMRELARGLVVSLTTAHARVEALRREGVLKIRGRIALSKAWEELLGLSDGATRYTPFRPIARRVV